MKNPNKIDKSKVAIDWKPKNSTIAFYTKKKDFSKIKKNVQYKSYNGMRNSKIRSEVRKMLKMYRKMSARHTHFIEFNTQ